MDGAILLEKISQQILETHSLTQVTDKDLADYLGVKVTTISQYKRRNLTPLLVARLIRQSAVAHERRIVEESLRIIVEQFPISISVTNRAGNYRIFSISGEHTKPYYKGLKKELESSNGIYIFYDSRGKAIYAGKAKKQNLWKEINDVLNKKRAVQTIYNVYHPLNSEYTPSSEKRRNISKSPIYIGDYASYFSAYAIAENFIDKLEAYLIRAFPNDLTNIKMENI